MHLSTLLISSVTQGGDLGFPITRFMGMQYPESCLASHINFIRVIEPPKFTRTPLLYLQHLVTPYSAVDKKFMQRTKWFQTEGFGYQLEHATRPSTVGFALMDPVALLAWIYEKLHDWTDEYPWTDDEILTWVSVYQFSTATAAASVRIYYERRMHSLKADVPDATDYNPSVPLGLSYFHKDVILPPKLWGRTLGPVVFERQHERGGHFAAHEQPELLVADVREMFERGAAHIAKTFKLA